MPSIWTDISTKGFLKGDETCSGDPKAYGHSTDYLPGRYSDTTPGEGGSYSGHSINLPVLRSSGAGDQPEEINVDSPAKDGVLGLYGGCNNISSNISSREAEEGSTAGSTPSLPTNCLSERVGEVCWEDLSITESNMASSSSLQSITVLDKFCGTNKSVPTRGCRGKVQYQLERLTREAKMDLTWWSSLDRKIPWQSPLHPRIPSMKIESDASNMGWGARQGEHQTGGRWSMEEAPHHINYLELLAAFLALQCFAKHSHSVTILMRMDSVTAVTYQQTRGDPLTPTLSACPNHMGVVHRKENISTGRTPARAGQCSSRPRLKINEGSMRLDAESSGIQSNPAPNGAPRDRLVCFPTDETATKILQLEARSRGTRDRCILSGLVSDERICKSPMVPDSSMSESGKETSSQSGDGHTTVDLSAMVPHHPGDVGGLSQNTTSKRQSGALANRTSICNESGGSSISGMAHIRESFTSRGISAEASNLLLSS